MVKTPFHKGHFLMFQFVPVAEVIPCTYTKVHINGNTKLCSAYKLI